MVLGAIKPVVKLIDTDWTLVKLVLTDDKIVFIFHLTEQIEVHITLFKASHEIFVV